MWKFYFLKMSNIVLQSVCPDFCLFFFFLIKNDCKLRLQIAKRVLSFNSMLTVLTLCSVWRSEFSRSFFHLRPFQTLGGFASTWTNHKAETEYASDGSQSYYYYYYYYYFSNQFFKTTLSFKTESKGSGVPEWPRCPSQEFHHHILSYWLGGETQNKLSETQATDTRTLITEHVLKVGGLIWGWKLARRNKLGERNKRRIKSETNVCAARTLRRGSLVQER